MAPLPLSTSPRVIPHLLLLTLLPSTLASTSNPFLTFHSPPQPLSLLSTSFANTPIPAETHAEQAHIQQNQPETNKAFDQAKQLQAEAAAAARARRSMQDDRIDHAIRARQAAESVSAQRVLEDPLEKPKPVKKWEKRRAHAKLERHMEEVRLRRELEEQARGARVEDSIRTTTGMRRLSEANGKAESCSDGILNQDETATDCGGVCRDKTYVFKGLRFIHACKHAESCIVDADCLSRVCVKPDYICAPREPLALGTPEVEVLRRLHQAFFDLVQDETSAVLKPGDVRELILSTVNPDAQEIPGELADKLEGRIAEFKHSQGLNDDLNVDVHLGYINRGEPLAFIMSLFQLREE